MATGNPVSYDEVFLYLSKTCKYSPGCGESRKRAIRKFSQNITKRDGVLFYTNRKWIVDSNMQQQIMKSLHSDSGGGCHFGRDKTREKIVKRYYWHCIYQDIDCFLNTCEQCQKVCHMNFFIFYC